MDMQKLMTAHLQCDVTSHLSFPQITHEILIYTCDMWWKQPKKLSYKQKALFH
jgi:hypothetical protein